MPLSQRTIDIDYYQRRAEQEIVLAQSADHPQAVRAHFLLAGFYLDLVHNADAEPALPSLVPEG
jgi:hypothetical protein